MLQVAVISWIQQRELRQHRSGLLLLSRSPLFRFMNSFQFGGLAEQLATLAVGFVLMTGNSGLVVDLRNC